MTKFEFYTKDPQRLADLIEQAVGDALEAEGCSLDLKLPEKLSDQADGRLVTWKTFLEEDL